MTFCGFCEVPHGITDNSCTIWMLKSLSVPRKALSAPCYLMEAYTFHDSGTSGHEPDSLEAIHTLVGRGSSGSPPLTKPGLHRRTSTRQNPKDTSDNPDLDEGRGTSTGSNSSSSSSSSNGGGRTVSEAGVLLHLERCAHRQTRRALQEFKEKYENLLEEQKHAHHQPSRTRLAGSVLESLQNELEAGLTSLESLSSVASTDRLIDELKVILLQNIVAPSHGISKQHKVRDEMLHCSEGSYKHPHLHASSAVFTSSAADLPAKSAGFASSAADLPAKSARFASSAADLPAKSAGFASSAADLPAKSAGFASSAADLPAKSAVFTSSAADLHAKSAVFTFSAADLHAENAVFTSTAADLHAESAVFAFNAADLRALTAVFAFNATEVCMT
ncbi:hypothetical protein FHG87_015737 [Trinorchestia longiramus]|nr:hypothetical protein FHG87_015737 [Trinorchestia longiramus]